MGGGGQQGGFDALDYRKIKHGDAGKLGKYDILSVLPDKFARFLYEFHDFRFSGLDLPPLPADRSDFDVHGAIDNDQVWILLYLFASKYILIIAIIVIFSIIVIICIKIIWTVIKHMHINTIPLHQV